MLHLLRGAPALPRGHPLLTYRYDLSDTWTDAEMDAFGRGMRSHRKNWLAVSAEVRLIHKAITETLDPKSCYAFGCFVEYIGSKVKKLLFQFFFD